MRYSISAFMMLGILMFFLSSCQSQKKGLIKSNQNDKALLTQRVNFHIKCMNDRNFEPLENIYHKDFSSINPKVDFANKEAFLISLRKNLSQNKTLIKGEILEVNMESQISFVRLRWRIVNPLPNSDQWELTFDKNLLEIWKKNTKGIWQLSKVLFYQAE